MASRKDLENLLAIILVIFFIIICAYAIRSLNDENVLVLENDANWIAVTFAFIVIFLNLKLNIQKIKNNLIIVLIGAIIIMISTMLFLALSKTRPSNNNTITDETSDKIEKDK